MTSIECPESVWLTDPVLSPERSNARAGGDPVPARVPAGDTANQDHYHCYGFEKCVAVAAAGDGQGTALPLVRVCSRLIVLSRETKRRERLCLCAGGFRNQKRDE